MLPQVRIPVRVATWALILMLTNPRGREGLRRRSNKGVSLLSCNSVSCFVENLFGTCINLPNDISRRNCILLVKLIIYTSICCCRLECVIYRFLCKKNEDAPMTYLIYMFLCGYEGRNIGFCCFWLMKWTLDVGKSLLPLDKFLFLFYGSLFRLALIDLNQLVGLIQYRQSTIWSQILKTKTKNGYCLKISINQWEHKTDCYNQ